MLNEPAGVNFPTGPNVGETVPDFTLPDQHGASVSLMDALGGQRALLLFFRSVRW
jgi:peroxiredoxin